MNKKVWGGIAVALTLGVVIVFVRTWTGDWPYPSDVTTVEERGQFGDSFAIFSATVSALGFLGVVLTLALQQIQISQQSQELKRQAAHDEENRRRDAMAQYEHLLFRLLDYYKESVDSIRINRRGAEAMGREAISIILQDMQAEIRRRKLHFIDERELAPLRSGQATQTQKQLLDYVIVETCRVIQYKVGYQRRVIATLRTLLDHLEHRCPDRSEIETYRALVASQITHIEIQYIFATALIYESESKLRELLFKSGLFMRQDSSPYNFKLHQFLYKHLWGIEVGDPTRARRLAFRPRYSAEIRKLAAVAPLSKLLAKYSIGSPIRTESFQNRTLENSESSGK